MSPPPIAVAYWRSSGLALIARTVVEDGNATAAYSSGAVVLGRDGGTGYAVAVPDVSFVAK